MNARDCQQCRTAHYIADRDQTVCLHRNVAEPSTIANGRLIGLDAAVVRYRDTSAGKPMCGPAGAWFEPKEVTP